MFNLVNKNKTFTVFDIGADKVACVVFRLINDKPKIIAMDHKKSSGIKKNKLYDPNQLSMVIEKVFANTIKKLDRKKNNIIFSNITDSNILSKKKFTEINSGKFGITKKIVRKIFKKSILNSTIKGKQLIHSFPINFYIDNKKITDKPIGQICEKFGISCFNLMVDRFCFEALHNCYKKKKISVKGFFDSGVASSISSLTNSEKNQGSVCIDIGSSSSKVVVYLKNKIVYVANIPIGGNDVTLDISKGLEISPESAELAKIIYGTLNLPFNEKIEIDLDSNEKKLISENLLYGIIKPRYEEILEIIRDNLFDNLYARIGINSIVLTGGASKIFGIENLSEHIFNRKSRIGRIERPDSFFHNKPEFSTLLGLIELAKNYNKYDFATEYLNNKFLTIYDRVENWIEDSYA